MIDDEAVKAIENLHRLKVDGLLTEEEFEASKQKILFGASPRRPASAARPSAVGTPFTGELPGPDDHIGWATLPLRRYADFNGRSSRKEFWMFQLLPIGLTIAAAILVSTGGTDRYGDWNAFGNVTVGTLVLALIGLALPQLAAQVRRFHDQGRSGWLALLNLVPYVGPFIVFAFMLVDGTSGDNQFGPDPKTYVPAAPAAPEGEPPPPTTLQKMWWDPHGADRK